MAPASPVDRSRAGGSGTILVAEDEAGVRRATKRALESGGYSVIVAEDGVDALERFREHRNEIALVITDLDMPRLGGRQLAEALRLDGADVPVLFTSGSDAEALRGERGFLDGVPVLEKPWSLDGLFACVREILDGV